jgi:hypothetical protein
MAVPFGHVLSALGLANQFSYERGWWMAMSLVRA